MTSDLYKRIELSDTSENCIVFLMGIVVHNPYNLLARRFIKHSLDAILNELGKTKPAGFLTHLYIKGNPSLLVLYWKDLDGLLAYARDKSAQHFPAWFAFNDKISRTKAIGIWHEIYHLPAGSYSGTYRNCRLTGMAEFIPTHRLS